MTYRSTGIRHGEDGFDVDGELSLHEATPEGASPRWCQTRMTDSTTADGQPTPSARTLAYGVAERRGHAGGHGRLRTQLVQRHGAATARRLRLGLPGTWAPTPAELCRAAASTWIIRFGSPGRVMRHGQRPSAGSACRG